MAGSSPGYGSLEDIDDQVESELALRDSEERYRLASRTTNDVIWDWSAETTRITWGGAFTKVFGYPVFGGDTPLIWWLERVHPEDRDRVWSNQVAAIAVRNRDQWDHEYRFLRAAANRSTCIRAAIFNGTHRGEPSARSGPSWT